MLVLKLAIRPERQCDSNTGDAALSQRCATRLAQPGAHHQKNFMISLPHQKQKLRASTASRYCAVSGPPSKKCSSAGGSRRVDNGGAEHTAERGVGFARRGHGGSGWRRSTMPSLHPSPLSKQAACEWMSARLLTVLAAAVATPGGVCVGCHTRRGGWCVREAAAAAGACARARRLCCYTLPAASMLTCWAAAMTHCALLRTQSASAAIARRLREARAACGTKAWEPMLVLLVLLMWMWCPG